MQAAWSNRAWQDEVRATLELLEDPDVIFRLRASDVQHHETEVANALADVFVRMVMKQASHRCWSMSIWSEIAPLQWAGILDHDEEAAKAAFAQMRNDAETVLAALRASREGDGDREAHGSHDLRHAQSLDFARPCRLSSASSGFTSNWSCRSALLRLMFRWPAVFIITALQPYSSVL